MDKGPLNIFLTSSLLGKESFQVHGLPPDYEGNGYPKLPLETYVGRLDERDTRDLSIPISSIRFNNVTTYKKPKPKVS